MITIDNIREVLLSHIREEVENGNIEEREAPYEMEPSNRILQTVFKTRNFKVLIEIDDKVVSHKARNKVVLHKAYAIEIYSTPEYTSDENLITAYKDRYIINSLGAVRECFDNIHELAKWDNKEELSFLFEGLENIRVFD